jgi:ABC-type sugar transport system ATPase subunit
MALVTLDHVTKRYDKRTLSGLTDCSLSIPVGKILSLLGPSGAGKTTLLNIIKNELSIDSGTLCTKDNLSIATMGQDFRLNHEQTVFDNLISLLPQANGEEKNINLVRMALDQLELTNEMEKLPSQLSAGQHQRVLIASTLSQTPDLVLLDEPFAHLDYNLRHEIINQLFEIFNDKKISCLWVTHEITDALTYSDEIILLNHGLIQQIGMPQDLYYQPANLFTSQYFGTNNTFAGKFVASKDDHWTIDFLGQSFEIPTPAIETEHNDLLICVRPELIQVDSQSSMKSKIEQVIFKGQYSLLKTNFKGHELWMHVSGQCPYAIGDKIAFTIPQTAIHCLGEI